MEKLSAAGGPAWLEMSSSPAVRDSIKLDPWPITAKPDNIAIVVSGGEHPSHACWMQAITNRVIGHRISVPQEFGRLLGDAECNRHAGQDA